MGRVDKAARRRNRAHRKAHNKAAAKTRRLQTLACWDGGRSDTPTHKFQIIKQFPTALMLLTQKRFTEVVQTLECVNCGTVIEKTVPLIDKEEVEYVDNIENDW